LRKKENKITTIDRNQEQVEEKDKTTIAMET